MIVVIDNDDLHRLTKVLAHAVRTEEWEATEEEATALLERIVVAAHDGDESLRGFLEDTLGGVPTEISGATLNTLAETIVGGVRK